MNKKQEIIQIGEVEFKVLFPDLFPRTSKEEDEGLSESIREIGVKLPALTDENRGVIDGVRRLRAAAAHKLKAVPFIILPGLDENAKKHLAIKLNAQRRHMTQDQRLKLAIDLRKDGLSLRQITG